MFPRRHPTEEKSSGSGDSNEVTDKSYWATEWVLAIPGALRPMGMEPLDPMVQSQDSEIHFVISTPLLPQRKTHRHGRYNVDSSIGPEQKRINGLINSLIYCF